MGETPPYLIAVDEVTHRAFERCERAEENVTKAYYEAKASDFKSLTHNPNEMLQAVRRAADNERASALQALGWLLMRTIQDKR